MKEGLLRPILTLVVLVIFGVLALGSVAGEDLARVPLPEENYVTGR